MHALPLSDSFEATSNRVEPAVIVELFKCAHCSSRARGWVGGWFDVDDHNNDDYDENVLAQALLASTSNNDDFSIQLVHAHCEHVPLACWSRSS